MRTAPPVSQWLLMAIAILSLGGCTPTPNRLEGTWEYEGQIELASEMLKCHTEDRFALDGRYTSTSRARSKKGMTVIAVDMGTWKLEEEGRKLTVQIEDTRWEFTGGTARDRQAEESHFESVRSKLIERANAQNPIILSWFDENAFSYRIGEWKFTERRKR